MAAPTLTQEEAKLLNETIFEKLSSRDAALEKQAIDAVRALRRAGHDVTVFERADRIGGLLRYGIPEFKMEKRHIDRRLEQMTAEGTQFRTGVNVGVDITVEQLKEDYDAVVLAGGATAWRDLPIPGRELEGIYQAMEYLPWGNRVQLGDDVVDADAPPDPMAAVRERMKKAKTEWKAKSFLRDV